MGLTFGATAPSQVTKNFEALVSTSVEAYRHTLENNISEANALFYELKNSGRWETEDGSLYLTEDLVYENGTADSYSNYDELPDNTTDGITQVQYEWRQGAAAISYSEMERKKNKHRIANLIDAKITQAEEGFKDMFNRALLLGGVANGSSSNLYDPWTNSMNGSVFIDPLPKFIDFDPTASRFVGNINQNERSWWRNRTKTSAATTYLGLLLEMDNLMNTCNRGGGGRVNLIVVDQITFELLNAAYYAKYQTQAPSDADYPFDNIKFRKAKIVWDPFVPDAFSGTWSSNLTYGTAYFVNTSTFRMVSETETNFETTEFQKPPKGDSRLAHILFMGQLTCKHRRKNGVLGKIARTLTA